MSALDASPLLASTEPNNSLWRSDATEGAEADNFLLHQRSEKQWNTEHEQRTVVAEHDTSEPARTARRYHYHSTLDTHCTHVALCCRHSACSLSTVSVRSCSLSPVSYLVWRAALGEVCGTFLLIFVACGTPIVTHNMSNESTTAVNATSPILTLFVNNITVAMAVMGIIYSLASVSGAHVNPAVTLALWTSHHTSLRKLAIFIAAQLLGGTLALATLLLCYNGDTTVLQHTTVSRPASASLPSVFLMELLLTCVLIFVVLRVSFDNIEAEKRQMMEYRAVIGSAVGLTIAPTSNARLGYAPITIGFMILTLSVVGGGVSGAAMNPVRYLVPAVLCGEWDAWMAVYVLAELGGACLAVGLSQVFDATGRLAERSAEKAAELRQLRQPSLGGDDAASSRFARTAPVLERVLSVNARDGWKANGSMEVGKADQYV